MTSLDGSDLQLPITFQLRRTIALTPDPRQGCSTSSHHAHRVAPLQLPLSNYRQGVGS